LLVGADKIDFNVTNIDKRDVIQDIYLFDASTGQHDSSGIAASTTSNYYVQILT